MPKEREDVEATLEQGTTPDASPQKGKWRAIDWIAGGTVIAEVLWGLWWLITQVRHLIPWSPYVSIEHFAQFYCGVGLGVLSVGYLTLILWPIIFNILKILKMKIFKNSKQDKDSKQDNDPRWFHARILSSGIVGGAYAFLLPVVMSLPEGSVNSGGAAALRQAILLATGGLIGLIALGETRRKNDNDREAAESLRIHQQGTLNQQKEQFEKQLEKQQEQFEANAFKDRKAERRERYTKAVEQLGDEKAPIRMGGVYTLVGLVDEWLEEDKLSEDERIKEGQVIINSLCAYIRSPFTLASHYDEPSQDTPTSEGTYKDREQEFYAEKAILDSEADVRLSIIKEIHDRLQDPGKNLPGAWSDFEYDFSGSAFFYPIDLTNSYYTKSVNFGGSTYKGQANFGGSTYEGEADFSDSIYLGRADFSRSTYEQNVTFSNSIARSTYWGEADFGGSTYEGEADFSHSIYEGEADFSRSTYQKGANFRLSTYEGEADFSRSTYEKDVTFSTSDSDGSTYEGGADFSGSTYEGEADFSGSTYEEDVTFSTPYFRSIYLGRADFLGSTYYGWAGFSGSTYEEDVTFSTSDIDPTYTSRKGILFSTSSLRSTYLGRADFGGSTYWGLANFSDSIYEDETDFSGSIFCQEVYIGKNGDNGSFSRFTDYAPQFYDKKNRKNTLFGSHNNDFTVDIDKGYPIDLDSESIPLNCKFLTSEQKEYLEGKLQEIEKIQNKILEAKDPKDKAELSKKLRSLNKELHEWREEATTVQVEDVAAEDTKS